MIKASVTTNSTAATTAASDVLTDIDVLARQIDRDGFEGTSDDAIDHLLSASRAANGSPVLAEVLTDSTEPSAVRERAFGLLALQILSSIDHSRVTLAA